MQKEAKARIKINALLQESGWRFFDDKTGTRNIEVEGNVNLESLGDDFEDNNEVVSAYEQFQYVAEQVKKEPKR